MRKKDIKSKKKNRGLINSSTENYQKDEQLILPEVHNDRSYISYTSGENFSFGEDREFKTNPVASKYAFDLFKEEDASIAAPIIRVKHVRSPNKTEKWKIFNGMKVIFTIDGSKISKKEKQFLHSVEGVQFLLTQSKLGSLTISGLKKEMKEKITKLSGRSKQKGR